MLKLSAFTAGRDQAPVAPAAFYCPAVAPGILEEGRGEGTEAGACFWV